MVTFVRIGVTTFLTIPKDMRSQRLDDYENDVTQRGNFLGGQNLNENS